MTAVRFHGRGDVRVDEVEEPLCGKDEVKMRPAYVGICGSDIHEYISGPILVSKEAYPANGNEIPVTLGHEFSGIIEERYGGGMARFIVAPLEHFYALPDNVSLEAGALVEPLAVAWHAAKLSPFKANDTALVLGGGPIGIGVIQVLKLRGAKNIILVELMENRKKLGKELGATHIFDPKECDIPAEVSKVTNEVGADVIFDSAGVEVALNGIIGACRVHGTIVNIAVWENKPSLAVNDMTYSEINYMGAALYDEQSFLDVIKALSYGQQLNTDKMITARIKLAEAVEKGLQELVNHRDRHCKILIDAQA
ncbi:alcohol dehydrogenase [Penicillium waksmanii]|uniref:alcohol dehydrogenase n=1 Tax=Penicillium waksmanii TaxID=69791 RepID=UPI0025476938|nr:alcohol dehydrogenase [Penicillium waksmanii]KAJ6001148.1 alcohol dehydrogenase [Penicillium waksmanii]